MISDILLYDTLNYMSKMSVSYSLEERQKFISETIENKSKEKILDYIFEDGVKNMKRNFNFKYLNTLTRETPENWEGKSEKISEELLFSLLPEPDEKTLILLCGRGKMCKKFINPILIKLGHNEENIFVF